MGELTTQKLTGMSRRRFIESLAALGVTGSGLALMSKEALAETTENPEKEVPRLFGWRHTNHDEVTSTGARPEREPVYYKIPRHKWARVEAAHNAKERVAKILEEEFGESVPVGVTTHGSGSNRKKVVEVEYRLLESPTGDKIESPSVEFTEFKQKVEDKVGTTITGIAGAGTKKETRQTGIPVTVDRARRVQEYSYDYEYRASGVPAGALIRKPDSHVCTSGPAVWDNEIGAHVMLTAGHCLENINDVYQNDVTSSDLLGNVNQDKLKATGDFDVGVIDDLEFDTTSGFAGKGADQYQGPGIFGATSKTLMKDKEGDSSWTLHKQGISTERSSGYIDKVYQTDFRTTLDSEGGDSGGPVWRTSSTGRGYIAGIHGGSGNGYAYHTIMESVESEFNVTT